MDFNKIFGAEELYILAGTFFILFLWKLPSVLDEIDEFYGFITNRKGRRLKKIKNLEIEFNAELNTIIKKESNNIISGYMSNVSIDAFGEKNYKKFRKELLSFIKKKSSTLKLIEEFGGEITDWEEIITQIIEITEEKIDAKNKKIKFNSNMSPYEYESFCANEFNQNGWKSFATSGSSDQGVDVVATKGRTKLVAQCKMFAKPVGNKAVQEIVAGKRFYKASKGVVIATNGFTKSAYALADANKIKLIHHTQIADL